MLYLSQEKGKEIKKMFEQVVELFKAGYKVVVGTYYGEEAVETVEDIEDVFSEVEDGEWTSMDVEIDHEKKEIQLWIEDDE